MRIAVVGVGRIGVVHAGNLKAHDEVDSVVVVGRDGGRTRAVAARLDCDPAPDLATVLRDGVDGIVVATPSTDHARTVRSAAEAGVPVFCEKPISHDLDEAVACVAAAAAVPLQVGFQRRFDPGFARIRDLVTTGRLGRPLLVTSRTMDPAPPPRGYIPDSGGIFADCLIHDIDLLQWVVGRDVVSVSATGHAWGQDFADHDDVDTAGALLEFADGTIGLIAATRHNSAGYDCRLEAHGTSAAFMSGMDESTPVGLIQDRSTVLPRRPYQGFHDRFAAAFRGEIDAFVDMVSGAPSPCTGAEAITATRVARACELARREHRRVMVHKELQEVLKMPVVKHLPASAAGPELFEVLRADGAVIVEGFLDARRLDRLNTELDPLLEQAAPGHDDEFFNPTVADFFGERVRHVTSIPGKSAAFREEVLAHPVLTAVCDEFLLPNCADYHLNLAHVIDRGPQSEGQWLHRDDEGWTAYLEPSDMEVQVASLIALSDFTADNGATVVVPGSHGWDRSRRASESESCAAEMPAGSALVFLGSTLHAGGGNRTAGEWRRGMQVSYALGWLRTEENHYLATPLDVVRELPPREQELLGFGIHDAVARDAGALGHVDLMAPNVLMNQGRL